MILEIIIINIIGVVLAWNNFKKEKLKLWTMILAFVTFSVLLGIQSLILGKDSIAGSVMIFISIIFMIITLIFFVIAKTLKEKFEFIVLDLKEIATNLILFSVLAMLLMSSESCTYNMVNMFLPVLSILSGLSLILYLKKKQYI